MQAILTKVLPVTNCRPTRIKAICEAGTLTINWPCGADADKAHRTAAEALRDRLGWPDELLSGTLPGALGYCFVLDNKFARG